MKAGNNREGGTMIGSIQLGSIMQNIQSKMLCRF